MTDEMKLLGPAPDCRLDRVQWRIDSKGYQRESSPTGFVARWVPYLDAQTVAELLDEWVGAENWWDEYHQIDTLAGHPALECRLTIQVYEGHTVTKRDVGVSPGGGIAEMEVKGIYSDAFKRAGSLKWGVGRNVYLLPSVWAPVKESNGKVRQAPESIPAILRQVERSEAA